MPSATVDETKREVWIAITAQDGTNQIFRQPMSEPAFNDSRCKRTRAIALSTAPYLIPVYFTRARLACVRPLSPSWLSARDTAVRA